MSSSNPFSALLNPQNPRAQLAVLEPAADSDAPIKISLTEFALRDTSYECISYDRSAPPDAAATDVATISVDGVEQSIPKALESALRTFRRKERPRTFWADLLVGRTAAERSAQAVSQKHVLQHAERTLCWLGPDKGEQTTKAFETIHEMSRRWSDACGKAGMSADVSLSKATIQQLSSVGRDLNDCPYNDLNSFDFAHWNIIYDVFGASYWRSVQCISDITLAKSPIVVCGRSNIRWHAYIAASRAMPFYQKKFFQVPLLPRVTQGFAIANQIEIAERRRRLGESIELLPMIQTARVCQSADPRENIFAMTLIATPSARIQSHSAGPQPLPAIDYGKSVTQVFIEAARYSILERQDLILWMGDRPPCARRTKGLPSWVPDFGFLPPTIPNAFDPNGGMRMWWENIEPAAAKKPITISPLPPISTSTSSPTPAEEPRLALHLQARPLDRIVHVSPIFNAGNCRHLCFIAFSKLHTSPLTAETRAQFWRTLILDADSTHLASAQLRDTVSPPASMENNFTSLIAEETILHTLGCASLTELQTPANAARMRANPMLMDLVPRCGQAAPYEKLLAKHAAGRRFFRTAGGRFGMTAIEDVGAADSNLLMEGRKSEGQGEGEGRSAGALGRLMSDPMTRGMMEGFQQFLSERDPAAARLAAQAVRGEIAVPGDGGGDEQERVDGGVQEGDLVVACVGGFLPYVLRPLSQPDAGSRREEAAGETDQNQNAQQAGESLGVDDDSTYEYVGECYLHGAMKGEDFQATGAFGRKYFNVDVSKLVDIKIV